MGLDARVFCNCLKEGRATDPPVSKELIFIDDDGFIDMQYPDGMTEKERYSLRDTLMLWTKDCCKHPYLRIPAHSAINPVTSGQAFRLHPASNPVASGQSQKIHADYVVVDY